MRVKMRHKTLIPGPNGPLLQSMPSSSITVDKKAIIALQRAKNTWAKYGCGDHVMPT